MRIRKGEVTLFISPNDWTRFRLAGWTKVQERTQELSKKYNDARIAKAKGGLKNVE